jgi:hypothetical protein
MLLISGFFWCCPNLYGFLNQGFCTVYGSTQVAKNRCLCHHCAGYQFILYFKPSRLRPFLHSPVFVVFHLLAPFILVYYGLGRILICCLPLYSLCRFPDVFSSSQRIQISTELRSKLDLVLNSCVGLGFKTTQSIPSFLFAQSDLRHLVLVSLIGKYIYLLLFLSYTLACVIILTYSIAHTDNFNNIYFIIIQDVGAKRRHVLYLEY